MPSRTFSRVLILSARKLVPIMLIFGGLVSSCGPVPSATPGSGLGEPSPTALADILTPTPQESESPPVQTDVDDTAQVFSSDQLGLCFSYPQGYAQLPYEDTVEIAAPEIPGSDLRGLFWLEKSDAYDRTAEVIADQDMTAAGLPSVARAFVTLDGEEGVVLDGMPGQDPQRRVYVVHEGTLYVLAFMPTRSENQAAGDQVEALYDAVTDSWSWSACAGSE